MKTSKPQLLQIDVEAAAALIEWKSVFAHAVVEGALQQAAKTKSSGTVSIVDYRAAVRQAILKLADAIESGVGTDGQQEDAGDSLERQTAIRRPER